MQPEVLRTRTDSAEQLVGTRLSVPQHWWLGISKFMATKDG